MSLKRIFILFFVIVFSAIVIKNIEYVVAFLLFAPASIFTVILGLIGISHLFSILSDIRDTTEDIRNNMRHEVYRYNNLSNIKLFEISQAEEAQRHQELLTEMKRNRRRGKKITRNIAKDREGNILAQEIIEE